MTDVTIRGIDDDVYARFAAEAKRRGVAIGELTTQMMLAALQESNRAVYNIGNLDELTVSRRDLESMDGPVIFSNIDLLEFAEDVDWPLFKERVERINNVDLVLISKSLSKFQILTKAKNVSSVAFKE